jgi:ABC-type Mn2+/Zn2+ transport system ATPase subunit
MTSSLFAQPLILDVSGTAHAIDPAAALIIGASASADVRVPGVPDKWLRFRYSSGWTGIAAAGTTVLLDDQPVLPVGKEPRILVRFTSPEWRRLEVTYEGTSLTIRVRLDGVSHPAPTVQLPVPAAQQTVGTLRPCASSSGGSGRRQVPLDGRALVIGRSEQGAEIEIGGADVAVRHASVRWNGHHLVVRDLHGGTGTYVDGQAILRASLAPGDTFVAGHSTFRVEPNGVISVAPMATPAALVVRSLAVRHRGAQRQVIEDLTFSLPAGGFLAVLGPSGVGKSSLFDALLGEAEITRGDAWLDGIRLGRSSAGPPLVSVVPQPNSSIVELSVAETLGYVAELRLARGVLHTERTAIVEDVMARLQLTDVRDNRPDKVSGGQLRRLNVAMELLQRPLLLLLDEPTSGLDEGLDRQLMTDLARLAGEGCVVVVVTHATSHLHLCDAVLAIRAEPSAGASTHGGAAGLGFFGPAESIRDSFGATSYADVLDSLRAGETARSTAEPSSSAVVPAPDPPARVDGHAADHVIPWPRACAVSVRRELRRLSRRTRLMSALVVGGPALTAGLAIVANPSGLSGTAQSPNRDLSFTIAVTCIWLSFLAMALSLTSVVADREVIERENRWGVPAVAVVLSRALSRVVPVLVQVVVAVTALLLLGGSPETKLAGVAPWAGLGLVLAGLTLATMCLGVVISTVAETVEQAVGLMAGTLGAMVILCGLVIPIGDVDWPKAVLQWAAYASPTRWAVAGLASYVDLTTSGGQGNDAMWRHDLTHLLIPIAVLLLFCVLALMFATRWLHRRLNPKSHR